VTVVAVVTPSFGDRWRDIDVVARQVAGALTTTDAPDVFVVGGAPESPRPDGALTVHRIAGAPRHAARDRALIRAVLGPYAEGDGWQCGCTDHLHAEVVAGIPDDLVVDVLAARGGDAPDLTAAVAEYEVVVVIGAGHAAAMQLTSGEGAVRPPVVLVPLLTGDPLANHRVVRAVVERAELVLDVTVPRRVHPLAAESAPAGLTGAPTIAVARDWNAPVPLTRIRDEAARLRDLMPSIRIVALGPGARGVAPGIGDDVGARGRADVARWLAHATAVWEPGPTGPLAAVTVDAMLLGTPVVVAERAVVARELVGRAQGGLWYRSGSELAGAVHALADPTARAALGGQAKAWAQQEYGAMHPFVASVTGAVNAVNQTRSG